jgi:CDP-4-dehydro-6-deoxyglucose reductase
MSKIVYRTTLVELNQVTPTMRELKLRIEDGYKMPFRAGQFVMLQVPAEGKPKPEQRAYSIASGADHDDRFTLLFKHFPGGVASEYVLKLTGGETLHFTGPWGRCFFKEPAAEQVIFVCTGSGLSQHISFLLSDAPNYPETKFHMLIGVSSESEMFYDKELKAIKERVKYFDYHWCLSRPSPEWTGRKGRVTAFIGDYDYKNKPTHIYLCGSGEMVKDVKRFLIEENGVPKENLIIENFG